MSTKPPEISGEFPHLHETDLSTDVVGRVAEALRSYEGNRLNITHFHSVQLARIAITSILEGK